MGNRLRTARYETSHLGQRILIPSTGREMSTGQSAVMLCGWGVKAGMVHSSLWMHVWVTGKTV